MNKKILTVLILSAITSVNAQTAKVSSNTNAVVNNNSKAEKSANVNEMFDKYKNENRIETLSKLSYEIELMKKLNEYKDSKNKLENIKEDEESSDSNSKSKKGSQITSPVFDPVIRGSNSVNAPNSMPGSNTGSVIAPGTGLLDAPVIQAFVSPIPTKPTIYSIMGFDDDYTAKLSLDGKSSYSVKKGDILPDNQKIFDITKYYVLVGEQTAIGRAINEPQKVFVSGKPLNSSITNMVGTASKSTSAKNADGTYKTSSSQSLGNTPKATTIVTPNGINGQQVTNAQASSAAAPVAPASTTTITKK